MGMRWQGVNGCRNQVSSVMNARMDIRICQGVWGFGEVKIWGQKAYVGHEGKRIWRSGGVSRYWGQKESKDIRIRSRIAVQLI